MQLACPKCGARDPRISQRKGLGEFIKGMLGVYPLRCRRCNERWTTSMWEGSAWRYARCPKCYRQELSTWSEQYYNPPSKIRWMLGAGATPYRCATCRYNFASFKKCKERFTWRHKDRAKPEDGSPDQVPQGPESAA